MNRKWLAGAVILLLIAPTAAFAASGDLLFSPKGIYLSLEKIIERKPVRIYASAYSSQQVDLRGFIRFFEDGEQIQFDQPVSIVAGKEDEVFVEWMPDPPGDHTIKAVLFSLSEGDNTSNNSIQKTVRVLYDSDHDGIPNIEDPDNDNDGATDAEEKTAGTNPDNPNDFPTAADTTPPPPPSPEPTATATATEPAAADDESTDSLIIAGLNEPISLETITSTDLNSPAKITEIFIDGQKMPASNSASPPQEIKLPDSGLHRIEALVTDASGKTISKSLTVFVIPPFLPWILITVIFLFLILAIFLIFSYSKRRR